MNAITMHTQQRHYYPAELAEEGREGWLSLSQPASLIGTRKTTTFWCKLSMVSLPVPEFQIPLMLQSRVPSPKQNFQSTAGSEQGMKRRHLSSSKNFFWAVERACTSLCPALLCLWSMPWSCWISKKQLESELHAWCLHTAWCKICVNVMWICAINTNSLLI